ncbi:phenylalanine ammonia-lyase [Apiospora aurea]|uniref:Phenylalanine ammonia-lyase n=1 Tax=Apiospora aurea TaxID=335848 RepID=A0ABR1PW84_9PEZI
MSSPVWSFTDLVLSQKPRLSKTSLPIDGQSLTVSDVIAVSRDLVHVGLTAKSIDSIKACTTIIPEKIAMGHAIYGVNTGFGGSADTRSDDVERVQQSLISHLTCGIIADDIQQLVPKINGHAGQSNGRDSPGDCFSERQEQRAVMRSSLPLNDPLSSTCMAESWSRASMLIRLNSLAGGASGIRLDIAASLVDLLNKDVVPRIPVRGSISASGDLSALAWIGAVMQGKPSATAYTGPRLGTTRKATRADVALAEADITPISLHAKEGLAIVNGTAVSAGVAALAAYEAVNLATLAQVLTAMSVEALRGSDESFEPFIGRVRPHSGQVDSARNIKAFLNGSRLLNRHDGGDVTLRQDRYSLRTSSQWIGPVLEDFCLAYHQLTVELNSVTDNPVIDPETSRVFHGGNFQVSTRPYPLFPGAPLEI